MLCFVSQMQCHCNVKIVDNLFMFVSTVTEFPQLDMHMSEWMERAGLGSGIDRWGQFASTQIKDMTTTTLGLLALANRCGSSECAGPGDWRV